MRLDFFFSTFGHGWWLYIGWNTAFCSRGNYAKVDNGFNVWIQENKVPTKEIHVDVSSQLCNSRLHKGQIPYNINYDCIENQVFYRGAIFTTELWRFYVWLQNWIIDSCKSISYVWLVKNGFLEVFDPYVHCWQISFLFNTSLGHWDDGFFYILHLLRNAWCDEIGLYTQPPIKLLIYSTFYVIFIFIFFFSGGEMTETLYCLLVQFISEIERLFG